MGLKDGREGLGELTGMKYEQTGEELVDRWNLKPQMTGDYNERPKDNIPIGALYYEPNWDILYRMDKDTNWRVVNQPDIWRIGFYEAPRGREAIDGRLPGGHNANSVTGSWVTWSGAWLNFWFPYRPGFNRWYAISYVGSYNTGGTTTDNNYKLRTAQVSTLYRVPYDTTGVVDNSFTPPVQFQTATHNMNPNNTYNVDHVSLYFGSEAAHYGWTKIEDSFADKDQEFWMDYIQELGNAAGGSWNMYMYNVTFWGLYVPVGYEEWMPTAPLLGLRPSVLFPAYG